MKTVLLLLVILTQLNAFKAFSQDLNPVIPFEDYRMCYTGFKTYAGDTIHQAKFESVYQLSTSYIEHSKYCWIVEEQGRLGVLNPVGEFVLPSHYDTIYQVKNRYRNSFKDGWLIIGLNERYGIIDFDGKEILPLNYQNIELHNRWLKVRNSQGKVGLLDTSSLQVDVPFEYEDIFYNDRRDFSKDTIVHFTYFTAKKNGYFGILKPDLTPILSYEFEAFRILGIWEDYILNPPYILAKKDGKEGLYNFDGKLIIPHEFSSIQLTTERNEFYRDEIQTASAINNKRFTFFNVETGERSEPFREIRLSKGKAIAQNKKGKWSVIDSNGSIMGTGPKDWYASEETLDLRDSIVVVSYSSNKNLNQPQRVLYHYGKGKFASEHCQWLIRKELDNEHYCWSKSSESIIIYDSQLRKIKTLEGDYSDIMEDLENERIPYILPIAVLKNDDGLLGGFDARGNEVIPQKYSLATVILKEERHEYMKYLKVPDYFEFTNGNSIAYYSLDGELIRELNFSSIYPLSSEYLFAEGRNYSSILDLNYNLVLDSCSHAFQYHTLNKDWSTQFKSKSTNNTYCVYAIRNQKYYLEVDGNFIPMDSSVLDFNNKLQFQFDVLIDPSGSIVSSKGAKIKLIGSHYIVEKEDSVVILSLDGAIRLQLDSVSNIDQDRDLLQLRFENGFQGIYSLTRNSWVIAPELQNIKRINRYLGKAKYCIKRPGVNPKWQFYSASGSKVSELTLDHSISSFGASNLVVINGKLGVMSSDFEMILPAEYDYISKVRESWFLRGNNNWYITSFPFTTISKSYTDVSTHSFPKGQLVYANGKIGVIDRNFKEVVPFSSEQELLQDYDLAAILFPEKNIQIDRFPIVSKDNAELARMINNRIILETSVLLTTKNDVMPLALQHAADPKNIRHLNEKERKTYETPSFFSKSYYSCSIYKSSKIWGIRDYDRKESTNYYNYEWRNGKLARIDLIDLFKVSHFEAHLDSLIIDYVNRKQLYGISCVNLEEMLTMAKENFVLKPEGIAFFAMDRNRDIVLIPYRELEVFLKRPEEFIDRME